MALLLILAPFASFDMLLISVKAGLASVARAENVPAAT